MIDPFGQDVTPLSAMWDSLSTGRKVPREQILYNTIHLGGHDFNTTIPLKLTDSRIFSKRPPDSFANKLSRILGLKNYIILKIQQEGGLEQGFVKIDATDLSKKLQIDSQVIKLCISNCPNLDLTMFIQQTIQAQIQARQSANHPKPLSLQSKVTHTQISQLASSQNNAQITHVPRLSPHKLQERNKLRQEAISCFLNLEAETGPNAKYSEAALKILSTDIEAWLESADQSLKNLETLISEVDEKVRLYRQSNIKIWIEYLRESRLESLLAMRSELQNWRTIRKNSSFIEERPIPLHDRLTQAEKTHRLQFNMENKQILQNLFNTHTAKDLLDPNTAC